MARTEADRVFFRFVAPDLMQWLRPGAGLRTGTPAELAHCGASEWIWLLDSRNVQTTTTSLPAASARVQAQALPFALEDQVLGSLEDQSIASLRLNRTDFAVSLTQRDRLLAAHQGLTGAGIPLTHCIVDVLALPCEQGEWTLFLHGNTAWLRCGGNTGFQCEISQWPAFLETALAAESPPTRLRVIAAQPPTEALAGLAPDLPVLVLPAPADPLHLFAEGFRAGTAPDFVDVLPRTTREADGAVRRWWLATAAVLVLTLVGHTAYLVAHSARLATALEETEARSEQTFHALFPGITRVVDIRAQATQALAEAEGQASHGNDFLGLLNSAGAQLLGPDGGGLTLASASFERGALELRVRGPDMPTVERYRQRLQASALPVLTLSVEKRDDGAEASLRVGQLQ